MSKDKVHLRHIKALLVIAFIIICIAVVAVLWVMLPVSAEELAEERVKNKVKSEFVDLDRVDYIEELEGVNGKCYQYSIHDRKGEMIGMVTEDASSGAILSIGYRYNPNYGDPELSLDDAHRIAKEYLAKWGYALSGDYVLDKEEVFAEYSDIGDKHAYIYQLDWVRRAEGIVIAEDGCSMKIDAISGDVIFCSFPIGIGKEFNSAEMAKLKISEEDAIAIARNSCPSPETYYRSAGLDGKEDFQNVKTDVTENIEYVYMNVDGEYCLIERVQITYEYYPKLSEANDESRIGIKGYVFEIDGLTGEILGINQTL